MAGDTGDTEGDDSRVGYGRPPKATRFRKGRSGNPAGKPKGTRNRREIPGERLRALVLEEAYRPVKLRVGESVVTMPMIQAALRSLTQSAAKGEPRAQVVLFKMVSASEAEAAAQEEMVEEQREPEKPVIEIRVVDVIDGRPVPTGEVLYPYGGGPGEGEK